MPARSRLGGRGATAPRGGSPRGASASMRTSANWMVLARRSARIRMVPMRAPAFPVTFGMEAIVWPLMVSGELKFSTRPVHF